MFTVPLLNIEVRFLTGLEGPVALPPYGEEIIRVVPLVRCYYIHVSHKQDSVIIGFGGVDVYGYAVRKARRPVPTIQRPVAIVSPGALSSKLK
jgi:hypothetical protein